MPDKRTWPLPSFTGMAVELRCLRGPGRVRRFGPEDVSDPTTEAQGVFQTGTGEYDGREVCRPLFLRSG